MDLGDLLAGLFAPAAPGKRASRLERILGWLAVGGLVLVVGFVWVVYSGF